MYAPQIWHEPFGNLRGIFMPFSALYGVLQQQQRKRRMSSTASGARVYVSQSGSDVASGLSSGSPVATIARAMQIAANEPSVTIVEALTAGTWNEEAVFSRNGLTLLTTAGAIINGGGTRNGVNLAGKTDCTVQGFEILNTGSDQYAVVGLNAHRATLDLLHIHDCPKGPYLANCQSPRLINSNIHDITFRHGAEFRTCTTPRVEDTEFARCAGRGLYGYGSTGVVAERVFVHDSYDDGDYGFEFEGFFGQGADDWTLIGCWAGRTTGTRLKMGFISKTSSRTRFQRCVAWECGSGFADAGFYFKGSTDSQLYHSDSYGCYNGTYAGYDDVSGITSTNIDVRNNIIANNTFGIQIQNGSEVVSDYNDLYNNATLAKIGTTVYSQAAWQAALRDTHSLFVNPDYVTTVYGGFELPGGSPLLTAGGDIGEGAGLPLGHTGSTWGVA